MRHEKRSMWRYLNTRRGRILVAVITLAVLLFLTACSGPARMETEAGPPSVAAPGGITVTPLLMQTESSAEDATARPSSLRRIQTTPVSSMTRIPATEVDLGTEDAGPSYSQASELLNGATWVLASLDGRSVIDDTYLFLRVDGNVIEGFDGCNSLWGRHEDGTPIAKADGTFSGRQFGGTAIGCPDPIVFQAERYQNALVDGERFRATRDRLEILDRGGDVRLVFTRQEDLPGHAADLPGTQWRLLYDGNEIFDGSEFILAFLTDGLGAGTTSCRDFFTVYRTEKERINFHTTGMIGSTDGCPAGSGNPEGRFTTDLSYAKEYSVEEGHGQGLLHFRTSRGGALTFEQLPRAIDGIQGVEWRLTAFVESPGKGPELLPARNWDAIPGVDVTLQYDETGLRGSTGCSSYVSSTRKGTDGKREPAVLADGSVAQDRETTVTEKGCPETPQVMEQENRFVELLPLIRRVQVFGDHLAIHTEPGVFLLFHARYQHGSEDTD